MIRRNMFLFPPPKNEGKWSARIDVVKPVSKHLSNIRAAAEEAEPLTFRNIQTELQPIKKYLVIFELLLLSTGPGVA